MAFPEKSFHKATHHVFAKCHIKCRIGANVDNQFRRVNQTEFLLIAFNQFGNARVQSFHGVFQHRVGFYQIIQSLG